MLLVYFLLLSIPFILFGFVFLNQRGVQRFSVVSFATFFLLIFYVVFPILGQILGVVEPNALYAAVVCVCFLTLLVGFAFGARAPSLYVRKISSFSESSETKLLVVVLVLSAVCLMAYINALGGIGVAIINGVKLRYSGESLDVGPYAFLLHFVSLAKLCAAVAFYRLLSKETNQKKSMLFLIISVFVILFFALMNASRGSIFWLVIMLFYVYLNFHWMKKSSRAFKFKVLIIMMGLIVFAFITIAYGKKIVSAVADYSGDGQFEFRFSDHQERGENALARLYEEGAHVSRSLEFVVSNDVSYTYFGHFGNAFLALIPTRLTGISKPPKISEVNSLNLDNDHTASRPPGAIASLWYAGGFGGALVGCFVAGFLLSWFQKSGMRLSHYNPLITPYFIYLCFLFSRYSFNGDPQILLKSNFYLVVLFVLAFVSTYRVTFSGRLLTK